MLIGEFAALMTAVVWSGTSIAFSEASVRVGTMYVNVTRIFFAIFFLVVTMFVLQIEINLSATQIGNLAISGIIGLVFGDTFLFKAYRSIGPRLSMLMMSLAPAIAALCAYFFLGESISFIGIVGMGVTISGIGLVVLKREEKPTSNYKVDYTGIFYAFLGAVGQAVGLIFAKLALNEGEINGFVANFVRLFSALILLLPIALLTKRYQKPVTVFLKDKKALYATIIGSILGPYIGITLSMISITYAKVGIASTIMAMPPIIMLPMIYYYYKEKLSWISIIGAFIAVSGVAILFLK